MTCGGVFLGQGAKVFSGSTQGYLSTTSRKLKLSGSRNSSVIKEMLRKEMKRMEKSKRSEATLTVRMKHEDDYEMNGDSNLSHSVRAS